MHKNKQNRKNSENEITSFNTVSIDPMEIVWFDELEDAHLAAVVGGLPDDHGPCVSYEIVGG